MSNEQARPSRVGAESLATRDCFVSTLDLSRRSSPSAAGWLCASMGAAIHAFVLAALVVTALWSPIEDMSPALPPLVVHLAPPPPSPRGHGSAMELGASGSRRAASTSLPLEVEPATPVPMISDEVLTPNFAVPAGFEDGFSDGEGSGMEGGIPGGVLGGVPGGLVGGVVGGLGTDLPRFAQPDVGPSPVRMPQPSYTRQAIRDNVSGAVVLRVVIDERGRVEVLKVLKSVPELDEEAIRVVEADWRFHPATKNGRPVPALSDVVVRFNLY